MALLALLGGAVEVAFMGYDQWEFQEPIDWRYLRLCKGISLQNMALYGTVPPF